MYQQDTDQEEEKATGGLWGSPECLENPRVFLERTYLLYPGASSLSISHRVISEA